MQKVYKGATMGRQLSLMLLTQDDWSLWRDLRLQALGEAPYAFGSRLADWQGAGDIEARWRERLLSVPFNLVAVFNKVPVGMGSATERDRYGTVELISMWVAPSGRGHGVGDALIDAVVQWARKQEALRVSLDVTEGNLHATKLYLRHGFVEMGKLAQTSPEDAPERRFQRDLTGFAEH